MSEVLYRFTSRFHLPKILKDGFLKITDSNLKEDDETYKMVVWLTRGANGDGCVLEHLQLNKKEVRIKGLFFCGFALWDSFFELSLAFFLYYFLLWAVLVEKRNLC